MKASGRPFLLRSLGLQRQSCPQIRIAPALRASQRHGNVPHSRQIVLSVIKRILQKDTTTFGMQWCLFDLQPLEAGLYFSKVSVNLWTLSNSSNVVKA